MKFGDLVMVITDYPDGSTDYTYGNVGVISKIENHVTYGPDYTVHTMSSDYMYGEDQIRELTDEEARLALQTILMKGAR